MSLWVDKYRPKCLDDLVFHQPIGEMIKKMVLKGDFPHLLFYGPSGAGKHTMIQALLREVYGKSVTRTKTERRDFKATKSKTISMQFVGSSFHLEMTPSDAGIYDRVVVQEVIKEIASSHTIKTSKDAKAFKVVVLKEVDRLTRAAQHGLRRTMEKYMATCRLIICCENVSKVIDPLRSRCLAVRVPAPSAVEVQTVLNIIASNEGQNLNGEVANKIVELSCRNMRQAILMMESCYVSSAAGDPDNEGDLSKPVEVKLPAWRMFVDEIAKMAIEEQSPTRALKIRGKIYELMCNIIPPELIFRTLTECLMEKLDDRLRLEVTEWAAWHEHRMNTGDKPVKHIEAFLLRFMQAYRNWTTSLGF